LLFYLTTALQSLACRSRIAIRLYEYTCVLRLVAK